MLTFVLIVVGAWFVGVFGWSQIVGAIQNFATRGNRMLLPLIIWIIIIGITLFVVLKFLPAKILAWAIGMGIAFVQVLLQGKIE